MKYFVNLIMTGALICAACFTSCKDDDGNGDTKVQSVTPTMSEVYIQEGRTATVAATVSPTGADQKITWTSADPNIAELVGREYIDGISSTSIKGLILGSTTVTATSVGDPGKKAEIQVTVVPFIDSVTANVDTLTLVLGVTETVAVDAMVMPANAIQTLTWTSSNAAVATVADGVIRATGTGVATVTVASTFDPTKKATVEVEVVSLTGKAIHIASKFGNGLTVSWVNLGGDLVEFFYMNEAGQPASLIQPVTTQSSFIPDFGSTPLSYRTLYLSRGGRDTLKTSLTDFTGLIYDQTHDIKPSPDGNVIKACDFDIGGEGIGFHDGNSTNTGLNYRRDRGDTRSDGVTLERATPNIGSISAGDWWQYTVSVQDAGDYEIDFHVSVNGNGARCRVEVDGETSETYQMNNNGSWEDWRYYFNHYSLEPPKFHLSAGKHAIRFYVVGVNFNFNGLKLTYKP
ncbi:MAG: carbohydrate-binding protein [Prevotellaceae bacterium]|jgi:hypothetical protein|nr:carbohydrate-binding protein [Prevotellaceae bacterium]